MLIQNKDNYEDFLNSLSNALDITSSQFQKAKDHYEAVGSWLAKDDSPLSKYKPIIYPQGSFRLGTVIKPVNGEDEFDVDLVCRLELNYNQVTQKQLKEMIGNRLKENIAYKNMLEEEGRRCWTLNYKETTKFHMDILPAIKDNYDWLLENKVLIDYAQHAICITDKEDVEIYHLLSNKWHKSNPIGYANWFKEQMKVRLYEQRLILSEQKKVSIEKIQENEVKTPLQRAIQILKRHRDIMFGDDDDRPISIIITTLAAKAYSEESNIYLALENILKSMPSHIEEVKGVYSVNNPVNPSENFADKWEEYPSRKKNFFYWMEKAKEDIIDYIKQNQFPKSISNLKEVFGKRSVNEALSKSGFKQLLENIVPSKINKQILNASHKDSPPWHFQIIGSVSISARYKDSNRWHTITEDTIVPKGKSLKFVARTDTPKPYNVYWQIVNTGEEATQLDGLRGEFLKSKTAGAGGLTHTESTSYIGTHWIECFIVREESCGRVQ